MNLIENIKGFRAELAMVAGFAKRQKIGLDYHNIPQVTFLGLKTLIGNKPFGFKQGISSPDFGW